MAVGRTSRRVTDVPAWVRWLVRAVSVAMPWIIGALYVLTARDYRNDDTVAAQIVAVVLALVQGAALGWRHRHPELVTAVVVAAGLPYQLIVPEIGVSWAGLVALWSLALTRPPRVSLYGLAALLALAAVTLTVSPTGDVLFAMACSVGVWGLAEAARNRRTAIEEASRRAVSDEQARIARELHDVIAHSVAVIVVQASAAGDVFDTRPDQARLALRSIEDTGRDALRELRRLVGAVRPDAAGEPLPPQPGLQQIDELARPLRAAGLTVVVNREGSPASLPTGVDVSAYRIVQEALTNTLRHARATVAEVTFRYRPDALEIEIVDDGRAPPTRSAGERGFGLVGMRERAALLGGSLEAGPTPHGGFRVHALLPLDSAP
jgi:signal transduction histidine kinase